MIHIEFHPFQQALHHALQKPFSFQDLQRLVRRNAVHQGLRRLLFCPQHRRMGRQNLHPAVRVPGVGVHDASGQLHQLPDMACQQNPFRPVFHRRVDGVTQKIAVLHGGFQKLRVKFVQVIQPVIARNQNQILPSPGQLHFDIDPDRLDQRLFTHGLHDPAGPQHGDSALDAQAGIEGLRRQLFPAGNGNGHGDSAPISKPSADLLHALADHLPGDLVDGRRPHRLLQPGPRHAAHACAAVDLHACPFRPPDRRVNLQSIRHIRVIPGVLSDRAGGLPRRKLRIQHLQPKGNALRRHQLHLRRHAAPKKHPGRGLCGCSRAGTSGVAHTHFFVVFIYISI